MCDEYVNWTATHKVMDTFIQECMNKKIRDVWPKAI